MEFELIISRDISWNDLEEKQTQCVAEVARNPDRAFLLLSEPKPTLTYGLSANDQDLLWPRAVCESRGVTLARVGRGGKWTFHGPGQILAYPIVALPQLGYERRAIFRFMSDLRGVVLGYLQELSLEVAQGDRPFGVFAQQKKLVSFGMAAHRGISSHGLALYLSPQQSFFDAINPCGVPESRVISLTELGRVDSWEKTAQGLGLALKKGFKNKRNSVGLH